MVNTNKQLAKQKAVITRILGLTTYNNMSITEACAEVGIPRSTYYTWLSNDPDAVNEIANMVTDLQRVQLAEIASIEQTALHLLEERVGAGAMQDKDLIKALDYLNEKMDKLITAQGVSHANEEAASDYLSGVKQHRVPNRLEPFIDEATFNVRPQKDGSVDISVTQPRSIEDGEFTDVDPE
ncbi:MAG: phBC6A51 family helix-turn-helix protein [Euryarchaeota archaeon]|nr:phBC6A51 family helix-turn-helix protein [Euryarchaeota archaeon]